MIALEMMMPRIAEKAAVVAPRFEPPQPASNTANETKALRPEMRTDAVDTVSVSAEHMAQIRSANRTQDAVTKLVEEAPLLSVDERRSRYLVLMLENNVTNTQERNLRDALLPDSKQVVIAPAAHNEAPVANRLQEPYPELIAPRAPRVSQAQTPSPSVVQNNEAAEISAARASLLGRFFDNARTLSPNESRAVANKCLTDVHALDNDGAKAVALKKLFDCAVYGDRKKTAADRELARQDRMILTSSGLKAGSPVLSVVPEQASAHEALEAAEKSVQVASFSLPRMMQQQMIPTALDIVERMHSPSAKIVALTAIGRQMGGSAVAENRRFTELMYAVPNRADRSKILKEYTPGEVTWPMRLRMDASATSHFHRYGPSFGGYTDFSKLVERAEAEDKNPVIFPAL